MKKLISLIALVLCASLLAAPMALSEDFSATTIRLVQQYGMQYAPLYVMERLGILEKHMPGATIQWSQLSGGAAVNEALISGQLDVGFLGVSPLLVAWDKGVDYRIAMGLSVQPGELMVSDPSIQSIKDIQPHHKIAMPSLGALHHSWIAMAAEKELGDAHALDGNLVAMSYPDAYAALVSGTDIAGHFASMPYIAMEQDAGMHSILKSSDCMDEDTGVVTVVTRALYENQAAYEALLAALTEAIDLVNAQSDEVIKIIAEVENLTEEEARAYLNWQGVGYTTEPLGAMQLAEFGHKVGFIKRLPQSIDEICWPKRG